MKIFFQIAKYYLIDKKHETESIKTIHYFTGVVGLPGSGKKLIVDALFHLIEITRGKIMIGGTDIMTVPLEKLRSSLAIVPQDPVLFTGSIR